MSFDIVILSGKIPSPMPAMMCFLSFPFCIRIFLSNIPSLQIDVSVRRKNTGITPNKEQPPSSRILLQHIFSYNLKYPQFFYSSSLSSSSSSFLLSAPFAIIIFSFSRHHEPNKSGTSLILASFFDMCGQIS